MSHSEEEIVCLKRDLLALFAEMIGTDEKELVEAKSFYADLGLDSLVILKIVTVIENRYKIELDEDQLDLLDNLDSAYKYIDYLLERKRI